MSRNSFWLVGLKFDSNQKVKMKKGEGYAGDFAIFVA